MFNLLIGIDWGTTSLRIRLFDPLKIKIIDQVVSDQGTATLFNSWQQTNPGSLDHDNRVSYFLKHIQNQITKLSDHNQMNLEGIPIIISGMASSNIGMMELPYAELPFSIYGDHAIVQKFASSPLFNHPVFLLSGVRACDEVMRGEETQLVGIADELESLGCTDNTVVILPGTHSKHVYINDKEITKIETYVTGELFANLITNGLLKDAVEAKTQGLNPGDWKSFREGIDDSAKSNILNTLFKVRTNKLFDRYSKQENYQYLSGLLIGYEIRSLQKKSFRNVVLCCSANLYEYYAQAMGYLNTIEHIYYLSPDKVELSTIKGQLKIFNCY